MKNEELIKRLVNADEIIDGKDKYDDSYYLYREKLHSASAWFRLAYGVKESDDFKCWHSRLRKKGLRLGRQMDKNLIIYDDKEWGVIQERWEGRK